MPGDLEIRRAWIVRAHSVPAEGHRGGPTGTPRRDSGAGVWFRLRFKGTGSHGPVRADQARELRQTTIPDFVIWRDSFGKKPGGEAGIRYRKILIRGRLIVTPCRTAVHDRSGFGKRRTRD